jgi:uncharacterized protein (DUF302 family)
MKVVMQTLNLNGLIMYRLLNGFMAFLLFSSVAVADNGLISMKSPHDVTTTTDRFEESLAAKGMTIFARINHTEGALKVGEELRPTELIIFGNPKVGTPLMQCAQSIAIDLPQKSLIWEDENGQVWLSYNDPVYMARRHNIRNCDEVLNKISNALGNFAKAATAQ